MTSPKSVQFYPLTCTANNFSFSEGWLNRFKIRNNFRSLSSHDEFVDAGTDTAQAELPIIQTILSSFSRKEEFNCDEFG